jgi:hypothetical protein
MVSTHATASSAGRAYEIGGLPVSVARTYAHGQAGWHKGRRPYAHASPAAGVALVSPSRYRPCRYAINDVRGDYGHFLVAVAESDDDPDNVLVTDALPSPAYAEVRRADCRPASVGHGLTVSPALAFHDGHPHHGAYVTSDIDRLLDAAKKAGPGERIELRDPIAARGAPAIPPLRVWLADPRLSAFAVRTLEKIGATHANRRDVLEALASIDPATVPESVAVDISGAMARLRGQTPEAASSIEQLAQTADEQWPGSREVSALELRFHTDMLDIFRLAGEATRRRRPDGTAQRGYWASYFLRGVRNHGGPDYARRLLRATGTSEGFQRLTNEGRLDLTVEALVLRPEYAAIFTDQERTIAAHRLAQGGYRSSPRA